MKVIHIIGNMGSGGAEKLLLETLPLYSKKGVVCDLLVLNGTNYPFMESLKKKNCCKIYSLGNGSIYNPLLIIKIIPFLRKYNIAHVHLFPAQYWVVFAKLFSFSKIKLILTEHNSTSLRMKNYFVNKFDKHLYSFYDKVICVTVAVNQILQKYTLLSESKFVVIENGVNLENIQNAKPYSKNEISSTLSNNDIVLLQVSRFTKQKNQDTVIKAMPHLAKNVKLIFIGDGALKRKSQELVKELSLTERVLFLGLRMDVPKFIKAVDISILSTNYEGFGLVAVEAMAAGKPFIGSNVEGLSNIVSGAGLLFEKEDEKGLAEIIKKLINNPHFYNIVVNNCIKRAQKYDINKMVAKHIDLYNSIFKQNEISS